MARFVALLRGVNVGGHAKVPMAALREACAALGWERVETFIQSGNLVFEADGEAGALERRLEGAIGKGFGIEVPAIVRTAAQWKAIAAGNPFAKEAEEAPSQVLLGLAKGKVATGAAEAIEAKGAAGERVRQVGEALWFHYPEGVGRSKVTPALIDRAAGSPVTARNWSTVLKLEEMVG